MQTMVRGDQVLSASLLALGAALALIGCGDPGTVTVVPATPASSVYVVQAPTSSSGSSTVLQFPANANGAVVPSSSLTLPVGFAVAGMGLDANGNLYAGGLLNNTASEILVYAAGASGSATPIRTMTLSSGIGGLAVSGTSIYVVAPTGGISVYQTTGTGAVTASRTIDGAMTGLDVTASQNSGIAVDFSDDLYVSQSNGVTGQVLVFVAAASGNVAPARTVTLNSFNFGVAADVASNFYVGTNTASQSGLGPGTIGEFSSSASGAATPARTIVTTGTTGALIGGVQVDAAQNVYALEFVSGASPFYAIVQIGTSQSGSVTPQGVITSTALTNPSTVLAIH